MLYKIDFVKDNLALRINRHIYIFLIKISNVGNNEEFSEDFVHIDFRADVIRANNLEKKLKEFFDKFKKLIIEDRKLTISTYRSSQYVENIISDTTIDGNLLKLDALPSSIRAVTARLFLYLYKDTLKKYKIKNYKSLYDTISNKICPFCGLEKLNSPDLYNQDYDHLIYKGKYPFLAVNMRNLIPMGSDCNQKYKTTKDILYNKTGVRRRFVDPYVSTQNISFDLTGSILPKGGKDKGSWKLKILPDNEYTSTWNDVFNIKNRYIKNELEQSFGTWLSHFVNYQNKQGKIWDDNLIKIELKNTGDSIINSPLDISSLIKGALYSFLATVDDDSFFLALLFDLNPKEAIA